MSVVGKIVKNILVVKSDRALQATFLSQTANRIKYNPIAAVVRSIR